MNRYTANYINTDSNFEINNIHDLQKKDEYFSIYCVLFNLLQRGCPTKLSDYLSEQMPNLYKGKLIRFFSKTTPNWGTTIKGYDRTNSFPARIFYNEILPKEFTEYPFFQQIVKPEEKISEFIFDGNKNFRDQCVDFLIEELKLVIEIDGDQHNELNQKLLDEQRDSYLSNNGFETIRIPSSVINSGNYSEYIKKIKDRLNSCSELMLTYKTAYDKCIVEGLSNEILKPVAIMRFQILILQLCMYGYISIKDKEWNLAIKNYEITGYERLAIEDIFHWMKNLCTISGLNFEEPVVNIQQTSQLDSFEEKTLKIEMSLLNKRTSFDRIVPDRIYVSNCWNQDKDYFQMAIAKPIEYILDDLKRDINANKDLNERRLALRFILKNLFGFGEFRPGQERIVINALKRRDTIGVLPTGSGKSLCYQLAVLLQPCISFCVCPIKSLMIDQDQNLKKGGISRTAYISSDLTAEQREDVQASFATNKYWWVFLSPERFQSENFRDYLSNMYVKKHIYFGYAVIDEVHCLSEWGHSFRVSYLNLIKSIKKYCGNVPLLGLTATASFNVLKNILVEFGMQDKRDVISIPSFTRPELNFKVDKIVLTEDEVVKKAKKKKTNKEPSTWDISRIRSETKYDVLKSILNGYAKFFPDLLYPKLEDTRCGIIFTAFVNGDNGCYPLSQKLRRDFKADVRCFGGEKPKKYDGSDEQWDVYKRDVQNDFKDNSYALLCATKAYGMGIDKPNVRYTVHYGIPSSLESLYQEAGRAGRDKNKAECRVIYAKETVFEDVIKNFLSVSAKPNEIKKFTENKENFFKGEDAFRQLFLLSNELADVDFELQFIDNIVSKYASPESTRIIVSSKENLSSLQKDIYHLSLIGVVEDWTVDWKSNSVKAYFSGYSVESVFESTQKYIQNYDVEYVLEKDSLFTRKENWTIEEAIHKAAEIFLTWYANNILYSRRQALLTVMEACDEYTDEKANEFKDKMEAYFRLDDISDLLGTIADQPREVQSWFEVLNADKIKKNKISNIIMNLNRFLESYQTNVGLNFISGLLNLIDHHFDTPNGRDRLLNAFERIRDFDSKDKEYVLRESAKLIAELGEDELKDEYSEFFIRNFDYDDSDRVIYKELEANYPLQTFLRRMMSSMVKDSGGKKNG